MALKITNEMQSTSDNGIDYNELYFRLSEQYRSIFMTKYDDTVFIYRPLGRGEFKEIMSDTTHNDFIKEEMLCVQCVIYPENFDWHNCPAGIPTALSQEILKKSFLDSADSIKLLKNYFRAEMYDFDNQVTCVIQEAFPKYDIEEIESWDMERTMKYLSRAEWKLKNFRGLELVDNEQNFYTDDKVEPIKEKSDKTIRGDSKKNKLTPEEIQKKAEFMKKFPMFAAPDDGDKGIEGLEQPNVDNTPYALRPGF